MRASITALVLLLCVDASAQTVDAVVGTHRGGCTTAGFEGLSEQLVRSHLCELPGTVAEFAPHPGITLTSGRVHALAAAETVSALQTVAARTPLSINSAFRTLVQQYALYHEGGCGLAAAPGNSNHQTGRAVDLGNYSAALSAMLAAGCTHPYPGSDPVHFDCPGPDMRAASVRVFQTLWNRNHPEDLIGEDGIYGPQTADRLARSPAGGFSNDLCEEPEPVATHGARLLMHTFGDRVVLRPGEQLVGTIELENIGTETWDGSVMLGTTEPRDRPSPFFGSDWPNDHRAAAVEGSVAPGDSFPFTFTLRAPDETGEYVETFGIVREGVVWFSDPGELGPADDSLAINISVVLEGGPPTLRSDAGGGLRDAGAWTGGGEDRPLGVGGCSAAARPGESTPLLAWLFLALLGLRRSRD